MAPLAPSTSTSIPGSFEGLRTGSFPLRQAQGRLWEGKGGRGERLRVYLLEPTDYMECCGLQRRLAEARRQGLVEDTLLLAQHPPTFCTGILGKDEHVLLNAEERRRLGIPYYRADRGGDVMYVGPGQVIAYAVFSLEGRGLDPIRHLRGLEEVVLRTLAHHGIAGRRVPGLTGVWAGEAKIAGVAIKVSRGVSTYGFNLNLDPDMTYFRHIVTCGNRGRDVTSMASLLGRAPETADVESCAIRAFEAVYR